jgi:hypothetical protein
VAFLLRFSGGAFVFTFAYLDKSKKDEFLPILFDIFHNNMSAILPSEALKESGRAEFVCEISRALEKEPRKIILCYCKGELAGFLMYYTNQNLLMIEELQLISKYRKTMLFYRLCRFLMANLPENIEKIEAFAHKQNESSISLQLKLGMKIIEDESNEFVHLKGNANEIRKHFVRQR